MNRLIVVILIAAGLWMGWWAVGSIALDHALNAWIAARQAAGWNVRVDSLSVEGFPNRFDTTLTGVRLADPKTGVSWTAPFVQFLSLAYRPTRVIAVLPPEHDLTLPGESLAITSTRTRASVFLRARPSLPLDRAILVADNLGVASTAGWDLAVTQARLAAEPETGGEHAYRIGAEADGLRPPQPLRHLLDPAASLPQTLSRLHFDATARLTGPLDRSALEKAPPRLTAIDLADLSGTWGAVSLSAAGRLTLDGDGRPEGTLSLHATEWRRILDMAATAGLVKSADRPGIERALALLEGRDGALDVPLTFAKGIAALGPFPLGPAPRLARP